MSGRKPRPVPALERVTAQYETVAAYFAVAWILTIRALGVLLLLSVTTGAAWGALVGATAVVKGTRAASACVSDGASNCVRWYWL